MKASNNIIYWTASLFLYDKKQANKLVKWLTKRDISFTFKFVDGAGSVPDFYEVVIKDFPWGYNLKKLGKFLDKIDYKLEV